MTPVIYQKEIGKLTEDYAIRIVKYGIYLRSIKVERAIVDQLIKSGTSIGANIREAKACSSRKEYIRFFEIALRSAHETGYWLKIINKIYHQEDRTKLLIIDLTEIQKIITSSIIKLKQNISKKA